MRTRSPIRDRKKRALSIAIGNHRHMSIPADRADEPEPFPRDQPTAGGQHKETVSKPQKALARSRTGYAWTGLVFAALLGILILVFILQNLDNADMKLLFWDFTLPLGVLVLLSVITGALVMALVGGARIVQLRRAARRG